MHISYIMQINVPANTSQLIAIVGLRKKPVSAAAAATANTKRSTQSAVK